MNSTIVNTDFELLWPLFFWTQYICYVTLYHVMSLLHYVMLCHTTPCYTTLTLQTCIFQWFGCSQYVL